MPTSRGLRPISFWVNETEKPRAPLGDGTEIHGGVLCLFFALCFTLPPAGKRFVGTSDYKLPRSPVHPPSASHGGACVCVHMARSAARLSWPPAQGTSFAAAYTRVPSPVILSQQTQTQMYTDTGLVCICALSYFWTLIISVGII